MDDGACWVSPTAVRSRLSHGTARDSRERAGRRATRDRVRPRSDPRLFCVPSRISSAPLRRYNAPAPTAPPIQACLAYAVPLEPELGQQPEQRRGDSRLSTLSGSAAPLCRPSRMHIGCRPSRIRYQSLKRALAATAEDRRVREPRQSLHSPVTHLPASIMDGEGRLVECSGQMTLQQRGRTPVTPAGHEAHMKPFCRSYASWKSFMKTEMPSSSLPGGRRKPMRVVDTGADGPS